MNYLDIISEQNREIALTFIKSNIADNCIAKNETLGNLFADAYNSLLLRDNTITPLEIKKHLSMELMSCYNKERAEHLLPIRILGISIVVSMVFIYIFAHFLDLMKFQCKEFVVNAKKFAFFCGVVGYVIVFAAGPGPI